MKCPHKIEGRCRSCANRARRGTYKWNSEAVKKREGENNPNWKGGIDTSYYLRRVTKIKCEYCGAIENLDVHHKDGNRHNNTNGNWQVLCRSCHMKEDYKIGKRKKRGCYAMSKMR